MLDFTRRARAVLEVYARDEGRRLQSDSIAAEHILLGLLHDKDCTACGVLQKLGIDTDLVRITAESYLEIRTSPVPLDVIAIDHTFKAVMDHARKIAEEQKMRQVGTGHLLLGLLLDGQSAGIDIISESGHDYQAIEKEVRNHENGSRRKGGQAESANSASGSLEEYVTDVTAQVAAGKTDPVIGRDSEIARMMRILCRKNKNNPVLLGEAGVGKTAVVEGLAQRIVAGTVPAIMQKKRILSLDLPSVVAGTKYRGEFEERLRRIIREVSDMPDVILFIDEMHTIIGAGAAEGAIDAANMLKPFLARGQLQCIGATTTKEYRRFVEKDAALERRFQIVRVDEPDATTALEILRGISDRYARYHGVEYADDALVASVRLSKRYIRDRFLPDKAIDLIDEAGAQAHIDAGDMPEALLSLESELETMLHRKAEHVAAQEYEQAAKLRDQILELKSDFDQKTGDWKARRGEFSMTIGSQDIARIVSQMTRIPLEKLSEDESCKLLKLEQFLSEKIINQNDAVRAVSKALRRSRTGLRAENRPLGVFLFAGPTGVGKTEMARILAEYLFDERSALIRIDMSEYMEKHTVSRLIGAPPGYVGYEEGGKLTNMVRERPFSVLLFDEIEKAHPDVFNIMLQLMEEGELSDSVHGPVSFRDTLIIMTANIGNTRFDRQLRPGFMNNDEGGTFRNEKVLEAVRSTFNPEFINRIDEIVCFHELDREAISRILDLQLDDLRKRCAHSVLSLELDAKVKEFVLEKGLSKSYGARFLKRTVQDLLEDTLAEYLLLHPHQKNHLRFELSGDQICVNVKGRKNDRRKTCAIKADNS